MFLVNIAIRSSNAKYETYPSIVEVGLHKEEYEQFYGPGVIAYISPNEKYNKEAEE
jgi:hypothetical protein